MNSLVNYIIQSVFCLLVFYGFYHVFLKRETCFQYNRAYLLFSSVLALSLPLLDFYALFGVSIWEKSGIIPVVYLPEITFTPEGAKYHTQGFELSLTDILVSLYFIGFAFFLVRFLIQILTIKKIIDKNRYNIKYWRGCYLINTQGKLPTFSFFRYLFWDNKAGFTEEEKFQILSHELVHIRQKHSLDIVYFELLGMLLWFNPLIRLYKNSMIDTHEFIADDRVIKNVDAAHYGHLIVMQLFRPMNLAVGSYFNKSQAYRRLNMMRINGQKTRSYKLLLSLPLVGALTLTMGFNANQGLAPADNNGNLPAIMENLNIGSKPYRNLLYIEKEAPHPSRLYEKPKEFQHIGTVSGKGIYQDDLTPPEPGAVIEGLPDDNDEIFTVVENQPFPAGGMEVFYSYVAKNLKYPTLARRMGIEGKVFIQFVVSKDGELRDVEVLKGIGAGCDGEAKRVLENAENWIPGYQLGRPVNVRMVLPITFSLG